MNVVPLKGKSPFIGRGCASPWGEYEFACCLTHDVDHTRKYRSAIHWIRRLGADLLKRKNVLMMARRTWEGMESAAGRRGYVRDFHWLIEMERRAGVAASYFFLMHDLAADGGYSIAEATEMIRAAEEGGMEIGLHGSLYSYNDENLLRSEKDKLDAIVTNKRYGVRQHHLRFMVPDTWVIQARCGFLYDCTFGAYNADGGQAGICLPFHPLDPETGGEIGIWEIPLTVMDGTLSKYMRLSPDEGLGVMRREVTKTAEAHGVFCLLWHNSSLDDVDWRGWRDVYLRILDFIQEKHGWIASGREIVDAWERKQ